MKRRVLAGLMCIFFFAGGLFIPRASAQEKEEAGQARRTYGRGELRKMISLVKTKTPPVIDGIMEKGEWDAAAAITGLTRVKSMIGQWGVLHGIDNLAGSQSTYWITYDDKCLYIAYHSPPPARIKGNIALIPAMLKRTQRLHDANIDWDDIIHIAIIDPVYPGGDKYVIQINSIGTTFDCIWGGPSGNAQGITLAWDPQIINQSTLTLDGWTLEAAIPWKGLGPHIKKPQPGEVKHMNFGRNWQEVIREAHAWAADDIKAPAGETFSAGPVGEVLFEGDEGIVVQLDETGNLPRGQAVFSAHIRNLFSTQKRVIAEISTDSGELKDKKEITLRPGESAPYRFAGMIRDFATTKIAFAVTDAAAGKVVHVTTLPVIRPTKPDIYVRRFRGLDLMKFETDISFIGAADLKETSVTVVVTNKATKKQVFRKTFKGFTSYQPALELSTRRWATGEYEARLIFNAPGMKKYETVLPYTHPALPHWWDNTYGYEDVELDKVPYPWTDMKVEDESVHVWGREYRFGKRLLPEQITTLDRPMLRAPMRVVMKTADGEVIDSSAVESKSEWTKINRTRVEGARAIEGKNVSLKNTFWAEYDGLVWNTLTIEPKKKVAVVSMELELPLRQEFTDVINTCDYSLRNTGKLKPEGYRGGPARPVWLGNGEGGIQWMSSESNRFFVKDKNRIMRVEVHEEGATLRIVMIDVPTDFDSPVAIQFGFIATPVRPKTLRTPEFQERSARGGIAWYPRGMEYVPAADPGYDYYGPSNKRIYVHTDPVNLSKEAMRKDATATDDFLFIDEFRANPTDRSDIIQTNLSSKAFRNYFVWRHWNYQQKYGYAGLYYDCPGGTGGTDSMLGTRDIMKRLYNITMSCPYYAAREQAIGVHQSAMPYMAYMGFATYHWDAENYNSIINANQQTYRGVTDPAMYRAQHMGHNFGWPTMFLGQERIRREWVQANGGPDAVLDQIYGLALLHDGVIGGVNGILPRIMGELVIQRQKEVRELGLHHWVYQFVPYWKQDIVTLADKDMHASFYIAHPSKLTVANPDIEGYFQMYKHLPDFMQRRIREDVEKEKNYLKYLKDRAVMVLYNNTAWEGVMRLAPDWEKLGLGSPEELKAENAMHRTGFRVEKTKDKDGKEVEKGVYFDRPEEYARIEGEELVFPMTKWNYRMIVIEKKASR